MDNSSIEQLVELPTIPTIAWTTPLIQKLVGVAHITHNFTATTFLFLKGGTLTSLYLNMA